MKKAFVLLVLAMGLTVFAFAQGDHTGGGRSFGEGTQRDHFALGEVNQSEGMAFDGSGTSNGFCCGAHIDSPVAEGGAGSSGGGFIDTRLGNSVGYSTRDESDSRLTDSSNGAGKGVINEGHGSGNGFAEGPAGTRS